MQDMCEHGEGHMTPHHSMSTDRFNVCRYDRTLNSVIQGYHV